jgi:hypothetical protein
MGVLEYLGRLIFHLRVSVVNLPVFHVTNSLLTLFASKLFSITLVICAPAGAGRGSEN